MLSYCLCGGLFACAAYLTKNYRKDKFATNEFVNTWDNVISSCGCSNMFELDNVKCDCEKGSFEGEITFLNGGNLNLLKKLTSTLECSYGADVRFELSKNKHYAKIYVKTSDSDDIYFKWDKIFRRKDLSNYNSETFSIRKIEDIVSFSNEKIGFKLFVDIPIGMSYNDLLEYKDNISTNLGFTDIQWSYENNCAEVSVLTSKLNKVNYRKVKVAPYELLVGYDKFCKPIILDFKKSPNLLCGGCPGSGKSTSIKLALMNLCLFNKNVELYFNMYTVKNDFDIFKNIEQFKDFSNDLENSIRILEDLYNEHKRRNKLFSNCKEYVSNIYDYNEYTKDILPIKILTVDEFANYSICENDSAKVKTLKKRYIELINLLAREARNSGIYLIILSQRAGEDIMNVGLRSYLTNKISYKQTNKATAYTILGLEELSKDALILDSDNREFLCSYVYGNCICNSFNITNKDFVELLKPLKVKDKQKDIYKDQKISCNTKKKKSNWENHVEKKFKKKCIA